MKKRILSLVLTIVMILGLIPSSVLAAPRDTTKNQVHVVVENTTFTPELAEERGIDWESHFWHGNLVDTWITLKEDSSMMSCILEALDEKGYKYNVGNNGTYITQINRLAEFDGGEGSGWMGTLNDWFVNQSFAAFTVEQGNLEDGDEIRVMYTSEGMGADLGGDYNNPTTQLKAIEFSEGTLDKTFDSNTKDYTLNLPADVNYVKITPTAANKNFQVHTRIGSTVYKRTKDVPVKNGTKITVTCGDGEAMNAGNTGATTYTFTVKKDFGDTPVTAKVNFSAQDGNVFLFKPVEEMEVSSDLAEKYGFEDGIHLSEGVSALDVLVRAHEVAFEDAFDKDTVKDLLTLNNGNPKVAFGTDEFLGFFVNGMFPHDGTVSQYGGYNGTTVATHLIQTGDDVEFYFYKDSQWKDAYTWFEDAAGYATTASVKAGKGLTLKVKNIPAMNGYLYKDIAAMHKAGLGTPGAKLAYLKDDTAELVKFSDAVADSEGNITVKFNNPGVYKLVAYSDSSKLISTPIKVTVTEATPETETVINMNSVSTTAKLYKATDTEKTKNYLAGVTPVGTKYTLTLDLGEYVLDAIAKDGKTYNGSIKLNVTAANNEFQVWTVTAYATNSGWTYGTDYTIENIGVLSGGGNGSVKREVTMGDSETAGRKTFLCLNGDTVDFYGTPTAARADYAKTYVNQTVTGANYCNKSFSIAAKVGYSVTYPYEDKDNDGKNDFVLEAGQMVNYYVFNHVDPDSEEKTDDGSNVKASFGAAKNGAYYYRISNSLNKSVVTYGSYVKCSQNVNDVVVTRDMLYADDSSTTPSTVIKDFSKNSYDVGDIYLNVNEKGFLNLAEGSEFKLYPYRNWLPIEGISNAQVIEPDFHVNVINLEGSPISINQSTANDASKNSYTIKANGKGTAIVLVTYDAVTNGVGMTGKKDADNKTIVGSIYSAIWPENTGVFVVSVGEDTGFDTGMKINEGLNAKSKLAKDYYDSELDVLYYTGTAGASYTFTPADGTDVSMAVCSYAGGAMTFGSFTKDGVTKNEDGSFTLTGLKEGKTIVKLTNGDKTEYQVLRSIHTEYRVYAGDGSDLNQLIFDSETGTYNDAVKVKAGDKVTVVYDKLFHPANKISGIYNMNGQLRLFGEDGSFANGKPNQYLFAYTAESHKATLTIPQYWTGSTFNITGALISNGFGSEYGMHRIITYEAGKTPNFTAGSYLGTFGKLPEIKLNLDKTEFVKGYFAYSKATGGAIPSKKITKVELADEKGTVISVKDNQEFTVIPGKDYQYTVYASGYKYKTGKFTVDADYTEDDIYVAAVKLDTTEEGAWDGITMTEPSKDEAGTYLIGTGAELAWYANESNVNKMVNVNAKLTADINLGSYPWTPIGQKSNYLATFDGDGHTVKGFFNNNASNGALVAATSAGSVIKNVTVEGESLTSSTAAAIVGYQYGGLVENCVGNVNFKAVSETANSVGGIAGYIYNGEIKNCVNNGTIDMSGFENAKNGFGGIAGLLTSKQAIITECTNNGDVIGAFSVGGILGCSTSTNSMKLYITDCVNNGNISGKSYIGGIVGAASYFHEIKGCTNNGSVSGQNYIGGIAGDVNGRNASVAGLIQNCLNNGEVNSTRDASLAGGIAGRIWNYEFLDRDINNGKVTSTGTAGGITAQIKKDDPNCKITDCYYSEDVSADKFGIAFTGKAEITDIDPAKNATDKILAIGTVTLNSESAILEAEKAYGELSEVQKSMVKNFADLGAAREAYDKLKAEKAESIVEATITMNTTSTSAKLYAADDTARAKDLLEGIAISGSKYTLNLDSGDYVLVAYSAKGTVNGSIKLTVNKNQKDFQIWTVTAYATNSGWTYGTDYTIENIGVLSGGGNGSVKREVTMGDSDTAGRKTFLCLNGDTVDFYGTPTAARADYAKTYVNQTVTGANYCTKSFTIAAKVGYSVTYPYEDKDNDGKNDFVLEAGQMVNYYVFNYVDPDSEEKTDDGANVKASFGAAKNGAYFYKVSNSLNKSVVTYGSYVKCSQNVNDVVVTRDMLYADDSSTTPSTVIKDFSKNSYDVGDIYLNVNEKGFLNLAEGSEFKLYPYRNWLPIEGISNAQVIEPDFHVNVINLEGSPISINQSTANDASKNSYTIKANGKGTAIVLVTYDAVTNGVGMTGKKDADNKTIVGSIYSAIWPENTGVFVVSVGEDTGFDTGMKINEGLNAKSKLAKDYYDSELDVLYYTGTAGASYTFTPADGTDVSMAVCSYAGGAMTFGSFTKDGVTKNEDGSFTLTGLKEGKTIVKLTNGDKTEYQVLRSLHTEYRVYKGDGSDLNQLVYDSATDTYNPDVKVKAGDKITVTYDRVFHPANKISGIYNMSGSIRLVGEDGTSVAGKGNQYLFASDVAAHSVTLTIPQYWEKESFKIKGTLNSAGFGSQYGMHRIITYEGGKTPNFSAGQYAGAFGALPEINLNLEKTNFVAGLISIKNDQGKAVKADAISKVVVKDKNGTELELTKSSFGFEFNTIAGMDITYDVYAKGYKFATGSFHVDDDAEEIFVKELTLATGAEGAWDGVSVKEPAKDAEGTYLIGNADELAWFANETNVNKKLDINAKLTADIDLGGYPWTPISENNNYAGTFDGDGHTVNGLYVYDRGNAGLFGKISNASAVIKNVTVKGEINTSKSKAGGIVGSLYTGTVENCVSNVNIKALSKDAANFGGITGSMYKGEIKNCVNNGTIDTSGFENNGSRFGGIAGDMTGSGGKITECTNNGTIKAFSSTAGIVGFVYYDVTIKDCVNNADVTGAENVGGIVGHLNDECDVIKCTNNGNVTGNENVGGIAGHVNDYRFSATESINNGNVTGTTNVGGLIGYSDGSGKENLVSVDKCINNGEVKATADAGIAGGLIGYVEDNTAVSTGINNGKVTAANAKGIVAKIEDGAENVTFTDCYYVDSNAEDFNGTSHTGKAAIADIAPAKEVSAAIAKLGTITLESEDAVTAARTAYDALNDVSKSMVKNAGDLATAEKTINELKQANADIEAAAATDKLIEAIGEVTLESEEAIKAADSSYEALTETQKSLVKNLSVLEKAKTAFATLKAEKEKEDAAALEARLKAVDAKISELYEITKTYLSNKTVDFAADVNSVGGEWWILGLARAGVEPKNADFYKNYYATVEEYVKANINASEQLHKSKGTDNSRVILALTALGYDPTNVAGHNLLKGLNSMKYVKKQGINGPIWALIAFDSGAYEIPGNDNASDVVTREKLIEDILSRQTPDGGWTLYGNTADVDMTGMAMQALAPYYKTNAKVKEAVDKAIAVMSERQSADGGYASYYGEDSSESVDQVIVALLALGINPLNDARFIKNGHSIMEVFEKFAVEGGGFKHVPSGSLDGMATEQAFYTLVAYSRFVKGQTSLYNMTDVEKIKPQDPDPTPVDPDPTPEEPVEGTTLDADLIREACTDLTRSLKEYSDAIERGEQPDTPIVQISMVNENGTVATVVPKDVLEIAKGKDVEVIFEMGEYSWIVNGKDITAEEVKSINLEVKAVTNVVPENVVSELARGNVAVQLRLTHEGDFGFKAKLRYNFGTEYSGKYANIYWYKADGTTELMSAGLIDDDGFAELAFTHASDYVVVISPENRMNEAVLDTEITNNEAETTTSPQTGDTLNFTLIVSLFILCIMAGTKVSLRLKKDNE
ncbi:MAG: DUF4430 domain-containing protein [Lachnospiraceae bacterium]|nr:DUF4430 domain-containing protein [Lachnospiraceae bacterium]